MAYNLQSLITILEQILDPQQTRWIHDHNKPKLESLHKKAVSLQRILEKSSAPKIESLNSHIRDAAYKAEDIIESGMVDQMLSSPEGVCFTFSTPDVQQVMQDPDSAMEQVMKLADGDKMSSVDSSSSGASFSSSKCVVVGVDALDLSHSHQLETLRCFSRFDTAGCCYLQKFKFPSTIKELTLDGCLLLPAVLTTVCALPKLEVLKICKCVFESDEAHEEWEAADGDEFSSLQFLQLESLDLERWTADETNFPRLRHLVIKECSKLEDIPSAFGEITTLQIIELAYCSASAVASAKQIQQHVQQSELEDYSLQLCITDTLSN